MAPEDHHHPGDPSPTAEANSDPNPSGVSNRYRSKRPRFRIACLDRLCIYCTCGRSSAGEAGQA
jgi:hypothetical protein